MTAALDVGEVGFGCRRRSASAGKAAGTSFWKKLMRPSICSSAISVKMRGGFLRFLRASSEDLRDLFFALDRRRAGACWWGRRAAP